MASGISDSDGHVLVTSRDRKAQVVAWICLWLIISKTVGD